MAKALGYIAGFAGLAVVGSGAVGDVFSKVPGVEASSAYAAGSSSAPGSAHPPDAGPPPDAGASMSSGAADAGVSVDGGGGGGGIALDGKIVLNLATEEDLRRLPGIGPSKAKAILELRKRLGRFRRVDDLLRVKGIGRRRLARLRPLLAVDP
jgi:competence protein ComEA